MPDGYSFADRLRTLMSTVHPPDRGPFLQKEVVAGVKELGGEISQQYLSELIRGVGRRPSERVIGYLAQFFGVDPAYFRDDAAYHRTNEYIAVIQERQRSDFLAMSARAVDLPEDAIARITEVVEEERRRAGLDG